MEWAAIVLAGIGVTLTGWVIVIERRNERRTTERNDVHWTLDRRGDAGWFLVNDGTDPALNVRVQVELYQQRFLIHRNEVDAGEALEIDVVEPQAEPEQYELGGQVWQSTGLVDFPHESWRVTWTTPLGTWREAEG